jgi:Protein of unknown function (DUF3105)
MSMSTQHGGGSRRPSTTKPGGKPGDKSAAKGTGKAAGTEAAPDKGRTEAVPDKGSDKGLDKGKDTTAAKAAPETKGKSATKSGGTKPAGTRPASGARAPGGRPGSGGRSAAATKSGGRRPVTPVKVNQGRPWGPIMLYSGVGLVAVLIIGFGVYQIYQNGRGWEDKANSISGLVNYRKKDKTFAQAGQHAWGPLTYKQSPPVGGTHNFNWQNCMGDVYDAPIANEHAVHSLEHGAVWVAYNPSKLSTAQVDQLAKKVRGKEYMFMSPYPSLDKAVSLQAWGYQLKVDSSTDPRIDQFVSALRKNASIESGALCSGGITETGTTPHDLGKDQPQQGGQQQMPGVQPTG